MIHGDILLISGDISDDIDMSINYLDSITKYYKKVLFIDGNHEHIKVFPKLYSNSEIQSKIDKLNNEKLIYLPNNDYIEDGILIIGFNGWWDFLGDNPKFKEKYHENEMSKIIYTKNVIEQANKDYNILINKLLKYQNNKNIKKIVIATHTIPRVCLGHSQKYHLQVNSKIMNFLESKDKILNKVVLWFYGHNDRQEVNFDNVIKYISHPRGMPINTSRYKYLPKKKLL